MEHYTLLSASGPRNSHKKQNYVSHLKIWVCRVVFTPVKPHVWSRFQYVLLHKKHALISMAASFLLHHRPTVPPCAHPASTTCTLHGLRAFVWWPSHTMWTEDALREVQTEACLVFQQWGWTKAGHAVMFARASSPKFRPPPPVTHYLQSSVR